MRLLLDTHVFIWSVMASRNLKADARVPVRGRRRLRVRGLHLGDRHQVAPGEN
jgi:hypothetical protein